MTLLDVPHELGIVKPHGAIEIFPRGRHQRRGEFRVAARSIVKGTMSYRQAPCDRIPLIVRLVRATTPGNTWISSDIRGGDLAGDQLHHLVANVALSPGMV